MKMPKYDTIDWYKFLLSKEEELLEKTTNWLNVEYPTKRETLEMDNGSWNLSERVALNSEVYRSKAIIKSCKENIDKYKKKILMM